MLTQSLDIFMFFFFFLSPKFFLPFFPCSCQQPYVAVVRSGILSLCVGYVVVGGMVVDDSFSRLTEV